MPLRRLSGERFNMDNPKEFVKVYCVFENDWEGQFLCDIFLSKEKAEADAAERNSKFKDKNFSAEEWEIQE